MLIADDDRGLCLSLRDVLELKEHRVEVVHTGADALAACAESSFDVLLLDISLPDVSGVELIAQIEEQSPDLDILIITGHASLDSAVHAVSRATIGYMIKPLDLDRLLGVLERIARRRRMENENLRLASERELLIGRLERQNAELERYAYTVSHDLKSPLIPITGFLGLLERAARQRDERALESAIGRIDKAAKQMKQMLDELLELSKLGRSANPSEAVALSELAREAVAQLEAGDEAKRVQFVVADDLPTIHCDRVRMREVFQNLIENAVKFMGQQAAPRVEVGVRVDDGERVIFVVDNGIGIAERYHDKIFGLFDKLDSAALGSGIGLALVKRIIEVHGGRVWVESEGGGQGSAFCFTISPALSA